METDALHLDPVEPFVPSNEVEQLLLAYHHSQSKLAEVKLFQALVDGWIAVVMEGEWNPEDPASKFLPLVLNSPNGYQVAAFFTSEDRVVPNVVKVFPNHKYILWTTAKHAFEKLPEGIGAVLNPFSHLVAEWKPDDFHNKLRWLGIKPDPRPWWRKMFG